MGPPEGKCLDIDTVSQNRLNDLKRGTEGLMDRRTDGIFCIFGFPVSKNKLEKTCFQKKKNRFFDRMFRMNFFIERKVQTFKTDVTEYGGLTSNKTKSATKSGSKLS